MVCSLTHLKQPTAKILRFPKGNGINGLKLNRWLVAGKEVNSLEFASRWAAQTSLLFNFNGLACGFMP
jgi:hypothetical protein